VSKKKELAGQKFGRLLVLYDTSERKHREVVWHCYCDCGNEVNVTTYQLTSGHTKSCGCYQKERVAEANTTHGMTDHPTHYVWVAMLQRCENPSDKAYKNYGGRGITVCAEWHNAEKFINWALASGWEKGLSIDRIDNDGNYEPSNCRWATRKEQQRNRRNNRLIVFNGKTQCLADWAEEVGMDFATLWHRLYHFHWPIERAFTEPARRVGHVS